MSEELHQRGLTERGAPFGPFEYYNIGATSIGALKRFKIVPNRDYGKAATGKPDGLLVDRRERKNISVLLVVEYKAPDEFDTAPKKAKAVKQCVDDYCKPLGAKLGVVTDTQEWLWVNPQLQEDHPLPVILREDGYPLHSPFIWQGEAESQPTVALVNRLLKEITPTNSQLLKEEYQNPSRLAAGVWQTIWLASGENPDACLATFVEIFVFKYLSDLNVLTTDESGIAVSFRETLAKDRDKCLAYYFRVVRPHIKKLFPANPEDGTSIINGIVLKPDVTEHNSLFHKILKEFEKFGPLHRIDPEFKSRLYETFLKRSISQKNWGQFFTPRNIVKAMVEMSRMELLPDGAKVHDPACGVGGFILEPMLNKRPRDYGFANSHIARKLDYTGVDRDEKTVILAKANMLIHLNELMGLNKASPKEFARVFNETFRSAHKSVLGSLANPERDVYDLILTNPPFVTTGTSKYKQAIKESGPLADYYRVSAKGVESLFLEKIIRSLKPGRKAFVIIPDGIANRSTDVGLRAFVREQCVVDAVISLPWRAFYTTDKKTYILALTKKADPLVAQTDPVFTYVVTQTGETLDSSRFECANDLPEMVRLFKYFEADKAGLQSPTLKCKVWPVERFAPEAAWSVDRWLTPEERRALGILQEARVITVTEFAERLEEERKEILAAKRKLMALEAEIPDPEHTHDVRLGDRQFFDMGIGERMLRKDYHKAEKGDVPVFSANMDKPFLWVADPAVRPSTHDCVLWGIDSDLFRFRVVPKGTRFLTTDHCGCLRILDPDIDASYLRHRLIAYAIVSTLDRQLRPSLRNMQDVIIPFPVAVDAKGNPKTKKPARRENLTDPETVPVFDRKAQAQVAALYDTFERVQFDLARRMRMLAALTMEPLE